MKAVLISRHELLPSQRRALEKAGLEIVKTVAAVPTEPAELRKFIEQLKSEGVEAIVAAALPLPLLVQLQNHFPIFILKMRQVAVANNEEEAKRIVNEAPERRVALPPIRGPHWRVVEFEGLYKVRVQLEEELVAPAE